MILKKKSKKKSKTNKIQIIEKKLGRERADGMCFIGENKIIIDERLRGKNRLFCLCHEVIHAMFGEKLSEKEVLKYEKIIGNALWEQGYRKCDNKLK